jgi:outer membrane autotransporter protein
VSRLATASRLAAALLATTCLTPIAVIAVSAPSLADGGQGNGGAAGGSDSLGGGGSIGASSAGGGGGGGAGVAGGKGGDGGPGNLGGNGGATAGAGGQNAINGGGGGGAHGEVVSLPGAIGPATGGDGGSSDLLGGGGAGGYGAAVTGSGAFTNSGVVAGGFGGNGGDSGGGGGSGGIGIAFGASGATLANSSSIRGGGGGQGTSLSGGSGGAGVSGTDLGINNTSTIDGGRGGEGIPGGTGGAGISGSRLTITNNVGASISGGVGGAANESHSGDGGAGINSSSSTVTNSGSIAGGAAGVSSIGDDGNGATGITGSSLTITNTGSITGGSSIFGNGGAGISASGTTVINSGSITGALGSGGTRANAITFTGGTNVLELQAGSTITGNVVASGANDTLRLGGSTDAGFDVGQIGSAAQFRNFGQFEKTGTSTWTLTGTPGQAMPWTISQGALAVDNAGSLGTSTLTFNGGTLQALAALTFTNAIALSGSGTVDTNGNDVTLSGTITGGGGLTKTGAGMLLLDGASSYSGTTSVSQGRLAAGTGAFSANSTFAIAAAGMLDIRGTNQTIGGLTGPGTVTNDGGTAATLTVGANGASTSFDGILQDGTSSLGLTKTGGGRLSLTGTNTYTGPTSVLGGTLAVNGSITSNVTIGVAGTLGGNGTISGSVTNSGAVAPGNSIGTLTVNGSYTQAAGSTYQVEVNSAGQNDRLNVTGAPGTAMLNGGTVQVIAAPGTYGRTTTYTILNATGNITGAFTGVTSNFAFLRPSLDYDLNNVFLTLTLQGFSFASLTPNQRAVGTALDRSFAGATGDFADVLGTLAGLDTVQGPKALNALSGEPYADFGTVNVAATASFMNAVGQQASAARGAPVNGTRQALAQACDADACDTAHPWGVWASALGGLGSVQGDGNASTLTYNFGGVAAGLDYRFDPRFLVGMAAGFTSGSLWVDSFGGRGWSDSVAIAAYGSFTQAALYVDALAGYAHFDNRLQRQISFPGVQRTANGNTQANQAFGQIEAGYKLPTGIANTSVTPFARLQLSTTTQDGFSEWGANSIDLAVAAQTTISARGVLGVDLAGSFDIGGARILDLDLRLGWSHEYADASRPMTAAFAGAPGNPFTVYGAAPARDAAALGFQARTKVSDQAQLYLRYDGELSSESNTHTLNAGVRFVW